MSLVTELGLEPEDIRWYHLAACNKMPLNMFYDDYEVDEIFAENTDNVCLSCPVIKQCFSEGIENKERGVWGGIYLHLGRIDKVNNDHKTDDIWDRLENIHGRSLR